MPFAHRLDGSAPVRLSEFDPRESGGLTKADGVARADALGEELAELEDLLYYAGRHALLIVLQGRDTAGKDGCIRRILTYSNVQSVRVEPFKVPTEEELAHDFLWRVHARAPRRGSVAIFNRSHYEDVLVVRVHNLAPEEVWRRRYAHINQFEQLLHDSDTLILKFYLHVSKEEQRERLLAREEEPEKAWKLSVQDWKEREHWDAYTAAYEDALQLCATPHAPWYVVPADRKWFRNLAVIERIVETLRPFRQEWLESLAGLGAQALHEIREYRAAKGEA
jgi:PPK2 family polyphosphate:nucleotide phosphotransferase